MDSRVNYAALYAAEAPAPEYYDEVPDFILELCVSTVDLQSKLDFEFFKEDLRDSDWHQEWAWYRGLGKGTKQSLKMLIDHKFPAGLKYADRVADPNWQIAGEFLIAMLELIREVGLVGSKPYRRAGKLYFAKEVDLS